MKRVLIFLVIVTSLVAASGAPIGIGNATPYSLSYSTSEVDTGRKWIDGKAIYSKTIAVTGPNATTANYAHGVTFGTFIRAYGQVDNGVNYLVLPYYRITANGIVLDIDNTNISLSSTINYSANTGYVTLEYTKP